MQLQWDHRDICKGLWAPGPCISDTVREGQTINQQHSLFFLCSSYIFKRLKFLGNKLLSQALALFFLAIWHGLHSGYLVCFQMELLIVIVERQVRFVRPTRRGSPALAFSLESGIFPTEGSSICSLWNWCSQAVLCCSWGFRLLASVWASCKSPVSFYGKSEELGIWVEGNGSAWQLGRLEDKHTSQIPPLDLPLVREQYSIFKSFS